MTEHELTIFNRIPKKYRQHITEVQIAKSGNYNDRGVELTDYTLVYDNGDIHTFNNLNFMLWKLREYTYRGYLTDC